ncbi:hypothetical protein AB0N64_09060 [Microbacterium sp. NPDC089318]
MTKQLITLIGALLTVAVLAVAVLLGVLPLMGGVASADAQRQDVIATNTGYETQIASLTEQSKRIDEIERAVAQLRSQIPGDELLNQVFERISRSGTTAGVDVVAVDRAEATVYAARTGTGEDTPEPAATEPSAEPAQTDTPVDQAEDVAAATDDPAADTTAGGATPTEPAAPAVAPRQQVELSIRALAPDIDSAFAFLDGLRAGPRAIAIDSVTTTRSEAGFDMQLTVITFLHDDGSE